MQSVWIEAGGDEQLSGGVRADIVGGSQAGVGRRHERIELVFQRLGLGLEELDPLGEHIGCD